MSQLELFPPSPDAAKPEPTVPSVESIRARLEALLEKFRGAEVMPLTERELAFWKVVTPQMSNWLPPEEKAAVCWEFETHLARLKAVQQHAH
ncbi:hypothetical protein [Caulobacter henricii]|uniref:Uncharacterized protein n=1 Tax=Caulobacter henricii TaxID=69395 RepID=A0A0P0NZL4_9CAUL|nr:hypothetical protein [Caulobacter henricii]ALL13189.1 hypothetical protein AQ619_07375 [Caulobacter henricii]